MLQNHMNTFDNVIAFLSQAKTGYQLCKKGKSKASVFDLFGDTLFAAKMGCLESPC